MEHPIEDDSVVEHRRYIESPASQEELEELALLAGQLLEQSTTVYASESIRRCPQGTLTLQSSVSEYDGKNIKNSCIIVTGPDYPDISFDILAEFDFYEYYELPSVGYGSGKGEPARDILISLIDSGKLDEVETELALFCIRRLAADIDDYEPIEDGLVTMSDGEQLRYIDAISKQVEARNKDFIVYNGYSHEHVADGYELTVASSAPSNPRRHNTLPRLQIVINEQGPDYKTTIQLKPDGSFVAIETDHTSDELPEEVHPKLYHVQKLRRAIIAALDELPEPVQETTHFFPRQPYDELLDTACRAWSVYDDLEEGAEGKDEAAEMYKRAVDLLRHDFEARYHLLGKPNPSGALIDLETTPRDISLLSLNFRNIVAILAPVFYVETKGGFCQVTVENDDLVRAEYSHLEGGTLIDGDGNPVKDIFIIGKPNRESDGGHCLIPLSRCVVLQFVRNNN